jgi:hypothetical protein
MPRPKIWDDSDTLVEDMREDWTARIGGDVDWEVSIRRAVGSNTFRAFRKLPNPPSQVFRDWAYDALITHGQFKDLRKVRTQADYDKWLQKLVSSLNRRWKRQMNIRIPFGPSFKLPNLLMKSICQRLPSSHQKRIVRFLHVPLDSFTLVGVRNCINLPGGRRIAKSASMSSIKDKREYQALQEGIRVLAQRAGVPPIAYDYLAWDVSH